MRRKNAYPLTLALVTQSMLGVLIRMGVVKANVGSRNELTRMGVVVQSVTFLEQFLRIALELGAGGGRGRRGGGAAIRSVRGLGRAVELGLSKIDALAGGFQSSAAVRGAAGRLRIGPLLEFVRANGAALDRLFRTRHALVHTVGVVEFDEAELHGTAEALVHAALEPRPRDMAALLLVEAGIMAAAGRRDDARGAYEGVIRVCDGLGEPERGEAWAHTCRGRANAGLGRYEKAEECYRAAVRADPKYAPAYLEMGHLRMRAGRRKKALSMYKRSIAADPRHVAAHVARGHALLPTRKRGVWRLAAESYGDALRIDSEEVSAYAGCGLALAGMGERKKAAAWYRRAISMDAADAAARTGLAGLLALGGRRGEAIKEYGIAVRAADRMDVRAAAGEDDLDEDGGVASPISRSLGLVAAYVGLGDALHDESRPREALAAYRRAAELDGKSAEAQLGAGDALLGMERHAGALAAYRRAAELDGGSVRARIGIGDALMGEGSPREALAAYRRAAELDGRSVRAHIGIGDALMGEGSPRDALLAYRRAAELDGGSAEAQLGAGDALMGEGSPRDALLAYRRAAELDGGSAEARDGLAKALEAVDRNTDADAAHGR